MLEKEEKQDIINQFRLNETDTGSIEVQMALLTKRINQLTEHLKLHPHDHHSRRALLKLIGKRGRFSAYLRKSDSEQYYTLISKLGLRK